jgi:hypothetical protein
MPRLIQDVQPIHQIETHATKAVQDRLRQVHHATNLPNLAEQSYRRVSSFDIVAPGSLRGFRQSRTKPTVPAKQTIAKPHQTANRQLSKVSSKKKYPATKTAMVSRQHKHKNRAWLRRLADFAQYPTVAIIAIGAAYSSTAGQIFIALYALISIILRLNSRYSFGAALLLLISIPFFQVIHQSGVSQNAAIYAYELLVLGTLLALIELFIDSRRKRLI